MSNTITCPKCQAQIEITEVMSAQLAVQIRSELEAELQPRRQELDKQAADLRKQQLATKKAQDAIDEQVQQKLAGERKQLLEQARARAAEDLAVELKDRDTQVAELKGKLQKAGETELALRKRERELKEKAEQLQLDVTRQVDAERDKIREAVRKQADEEHQLKAREKDQQIDGLRKQIDDLKRKAEQGSQQAQGEVLELALEDLLREAFPADSIEEVSKGVGGADVVQRVRTTGGVDCGIILWESKRTRNWQDGWLPKLRKDQREAGAAVAVLVTTTMPEGVDHFQQIDGVWVCSWSCAAGVAAAVRAGLLEVGKVRRALEGQQGKMEQVYQYLSSPQFRNRVAGIVESFVTMRADLEAEKRALMKHWAKREKQIDQAVGSTAGMYGDFQGIIGGSLPEIEGMSLPQLEAKD